MNAAPTLMKSGSVGSSRKTPAYAAVSLSDTSKFDQSCNRSQPVPFFSDRGQQIPQPVPARPT